MKQLKHYASIIAMLMLLSQITFTSCSEDFGPDIDKLKEDVSTLQNTVADLQKAYEGGKIITGVSPITTSQGGWQITFSDESTINLYNGANGSNGEDGADGVTPYMKIDTNGNWTVSYDNGETYAPITDAEGNTISSKGKDGTNGISVAVRENSEGNYEIISYLDDKENPLTVLSTPYSSNPANQIASIVENSDQGTVVITMSSGAEYKFVQKIIYPTSIIILTDEIFVDEEEEIAEIEFRINPSNARIDKDNIIVDQIRESYLKSYASSYTNPTPNYEIVSLNNSVNTEGEQLQGQYKLTIKHKGAQGRYEEICVLVISTLDSGNNPIEISSEKFYISSEIPCNVTVTASEGGTAEVDKTKVFPNKEVILTATPNEGFRFVNWTLNGVEVSVENPYTATITANSNFVATFESKLSSSLILKEIYYSMSKTTTGDQYINDQFFEIYNNSDKVQYLDNCVLARHQGSGSSVIPCRWVDDNGEILKTYPTDSYIAAFIGDGSGKSFPLEPGKSVVVAFQARNHVTNKNPNSVDLSGANYEVNISNYNTGYVNSAEVPDLTIITKSGSPITNYSFWMLPYSGTATILAKFDDDIDLKNYVNDNANWMTIPHQTASNVEYFMIPQKYVLDGVNIVGVDPTKQQSQLRAEIDAGRVTNSEIYNGKSIKRKVKETINGRVVYQDTNNSSDDFLTDQTPTPGVDANGKVINR